MKKMKTKAKAVKVKLKKWADTKKDWILATYFGLLAIGATTTPAFAIDLNTTTTEIRNQLTAPYYLCLGAICVFMWAKGRIAVAFTTLFVGLFFGIILLYQSEAQSLLTWLKTTLF